MPQGLRKGDLPGASRDIADKKFAQLVKQAEQSFDALESGYQDYSRYVNDLYERLAAIGLDAQDKLKDKNIVGKEKTAYEAAFKVSSALMRKLQAL
jgi:hypothetical protein